MRAAFSVVVLALSAVGTSPAAEPPRRPNVLWLIAEDFGPHLSCYGENQVDTPNLDRLAAEGMRFTRFYTTAPVCSPSRSALITGMYQTTIGAHNHRSHRDDGHALPAGVKLLTDWLRPAGYLTANLRTLPDSVGFSGSGKTDWNFQTNERPFDTNRWDDLPTHQPFYAQLNFQETHRQGSPPWRSPRVVDPKAVELPPYYPDHPITREDWAGYLDSAIALDAKIGKLRRLLEQTDLLESTVLVFFGDNGQAHVRGKQFCYEEGLNVPLLIRWPSKFPAPRGFQSGKVSDQLIASIDLTATTLAIAGVTKPSGMQGLVFLGEHADPPRSYVFGARDRCDETVARFRTVRDHRYRYIRNFLPDRPFLQSNDYKERSYPVWNLLKELDAQGKLTSSQKFLTAPTMPAEELYDLQSDPQEIRNLAASTDPTHREALDRLRAQLDRWIVETDDQGRFPEPPEVAAAKGATKPTAGATPKAKARAKSKAQAQSAKGKS